MYRALNFKVLMLVTASGVLSACGQSGALQRPDDPNFDHRAKYLIYSNTEVQTKQDRQNATENTTP